MDQDEHTLQTTSDREGSARTDSLVVAAFPWHNEQIASAHKLADVIPADHLSDVGYIYQSLALICG